MTSHWIRYSLSLATAIGLCSPVAADHHENAVGLAGVWKATASSDAGDDREIVWTLEKDGEDYTGTSVDSASGDERKLDRITVKGKEVTIEVDVEMDGVKGLIKVVVEEKEENKLTGKWILSGADGTEFISGAISAEKELTVAYAGKWKAISILPDGSELSSILALTGANEALKGSFQSAEGKDLKIGKVSADGKSLTLDFKMEIQGNTMDVAIQSDSKEQDKLVGKWIVKGGDGNEVASGDWSATREVEQRYAGEWAVKAAVPDGGEYTGTLTLKKSEDGYSGSSASSDGTARELKSVKVEDKTVVYTVPFEAEGVAGIITVSAKEQEDGTLAGTWSLAADGTELASDRWEARRPGE
ncbi:MAG: hypothetical protein R3F19_35045 [Verrucomicrobiales bacterium]